MSVAFDAASTGATTTTSPLQWTHTPAGTPTAVTVQVNIEASPLPTIGQVTYGGQNMTLIDGQSGSSVFNRVELWGLANPPSGAQTVSVPWTGSVTGVAGGAVTYTGSKTSSAFGTPNKASGSGSPTTVTISGATGDLIVDAMEIDAVAGAPTVGAGQTARIAVAVGVGNGLGRGSTEAGAASVVMSWTHGGGEWATVGVAVKNLVTAAITGTATASITETDIVNGGKTVIVTLTGDTFIT